MSDYTVNDSVTGETLYIAAGHIDAWAEHARYVAMGRNVYILCMWPCGCIRRSVFRVHKKIPRYGWRLKQRCGMRPGHYQPKREWVREGYPVCGVDPDAQAIKALKSLAPSGDFRAETLEGMSFPDHVADVVVSSAVLHFARDEAHFLAMLNNSWRVLKPDGLFFCRLASSIGMEHRVRKIEGRRHFLPDGSERFLVDEAMLMSLTAELGGRLLDPLKTSVVQDQRSMTTWVLRK